jgi:hypothetical protein
MGGGRGEERGEVHTVDVFGFVEVDTEDAAVREGDDQDIVGGLARDKVGGDGELELYGKDVEDG